MKQRKKGIQVTPGVKQKLDTNELNDKDVKDISGGYIEQDYGDDEYYVWTDKKNGSRTYIGRSKNLEEAKKMARDRGASDYVHYKSYDSPY